MGVNNNKFNPPDLYTIMYYHLNFKQAGATQVFLAGSISLASQHVVGMITQN